MSKYVIRAPFAVHLPKVSTTTQPGGGVIKQINTVSYFHHDQTPIELSDKEAFDHMHKLEPADDAAKKLFGDYNARQEAARAAQAGVLDSEGLEERIASAVTRALAAAGVIKAK